MVKVGKDEFCQKCMDWREYDEEGRCIVCGTLINKNLKPEKRDGYNDYKTETPSLENDDVEENDL